MPPTLDPVTQHHVDQAADRLAEEFVGVFSQETIARYIAESLDMLEGARINVFVPVLAHRFARERLSALAQTEGIVAKDQQEVLFVCVHNAGRIRRGVPETAAGEVGSAADVMITMGCGDCLPDLSGKALRGLGSRRLGRPRGRRGCDASATTSPSGGTGALERAAAQPGETT